MQIEILQTLMLHQQDIHVNENTNVNRNIDTQLPALNLNVIDGTSTLHSSSCTRSHAYSS